MHITYQSCVFNTPENTYRKHTWQISAQKVKNPFMSNHKKSANEQS